MGRGVGEQVRFLESRLDQIIRGCVEDHVGEPVLGFLRPGDDPGRYVHGDFERPLADQRRHRLARRYVFALTDRHVGDIAGERRDDHRVLQRFFGPVERGFCDIALRLALLEHAACDRILLGQPHGTLIFLVSRVELSAGRRQLAVEVALIEACDQFACLDALRVDDGDFLDQAADLEAQFGKV